MITLSTTIGSRPTLEVRTPNREAELAAGSDYRGGLVFTATLSRRDSQGLYLPTHGVHIANGKHARWTWFGIRGDRWLGRWRIAWWWPQRGLRTAEGAS